MVDFNKQLVLNALFGELDKILNWKPDYESYGIQFGPSISEALPIIDEILKIEPNYNRDFINKHLKDHILDQRLDKYYHLLPLATRDGIDHINVYSKGATSIGRFLSNFTKAPFTCEDGNFDSIEGYWYWLSCKDDKLRTLSGWTAKSYGRQVRAKDWCDDPEFKRKICAAIKAKVVKHSPSSLLFEMTENLPFKHYYVYGNKIVEPTEGKWIIEYLEKLRKEIIENSDD